MRQRISEKNVFPDFSVKEEHNKIEAIFRDQLPFGLIGGPLGTDHLRPSLSYESCLKAMFLNWPLRGTFTTFDEMTRELAIDDESFTDESSDNQLLDYIQFILNAIVFVNNEIASG